MPQPLLMISLGQQAATETPLQKEMGTQSRAQVQPQVQPKPQPQPQAQPVAQPHVPQTLQTLEATWNELLKAAGLI